jgi:hypothetical protein
MTKESKESGKGGKTLSLHEAIETNSSEIVESVLESGALVINDAKYLNGAINYYDNTLAVAIKTKNPEIVKLVLGAGAQIVMMAFYPNGRARTEHSTLGLAVKTRNPALVELIMGEVDKKKEEFSSRVVGFLTEFVESINLPQEVGEMVASFLTKREGAIVSQVSKSWQQVVMLQEDAILNNDNEEKQDLTTLTPDPVSPNTTPKPSEAVRLKSANRGMSK